jgi:acetolactate synthase I/II/III large subunit
VTLEDHSTSTPVGPLPCPDSTITMTGADAILRALEAAGAEVCFGLPGGAILPLYDALARGTSLRHVLAQHEQGAGHMAEGHARATGRPGVVFATSGPGATNLVTPIADAQMDSTPLVCITGQVRSDLIGTQAFQECDIVSVTAPLVKGSWSVRDPAELSAVVGEAYRLAAAGRPGPVLVDIPRDVQEAPVEPGGRWDRGRARPSRRRPRRERCAPSRGRSKNLPDLCSTSVAARSRRRRGERSGRSPRPPGPRS